ncbi:MAG: biotin synthase BioB [Firmicutes bacterium]|nr:biotin synthase BioB [Bacillota bacterium]
MPENTVNKIISGTMLQKSDIPALLASDTVSLCAAANKLRIHYRGNKISLCAIIDGIGGGCSEDCKFCAQGKACSKQTNLHAFTDEEEIINDCKYHEKAGVHRYSIVTAGRTLSAANFEKALSAYKRMHEECPEIQLCASHGLLNYEQLKQLKEAGVSRCHCNLETSERFFPKICTTHTYADKLKTIENAKKAGMEICSGGIIGMGETLDDRIDLAFKLRELGVSSIPINVLTPIKGTPLENAEQLTADEILRTVALFRLIVPKAEIRMAAGRKLLENNGIKAFLSGADATITGDMLTTTGSNIAADKKMFAENYFEI